jgi:hypothetical protein
MERIEVEILKVREYGESEYVAWESLSVKNSGGEGFLSYFSVFLPLLTYIRDAAGAGSRTAKVFIADNPFGKMVSPHLVRVVMDMARRTNTQVIAFTGISDAKIYPFFDRIYSLSLFPVNASTKLRIEIEVAKEGSGATKLSAMDAGLAAGAKSLFQENLF